MVILFTVGWTKSGTYRSVHLPSRDRRGLYSPHQPLPRPPAPWSCPRATTKRLIVSGDLYKSIQSISSIHHPYQQMTGRVIPDLK